ncbi:MAG: TonB-dependent receptor [Ignavibacteria bacterium]|nr:TonB-dependent receptor [Ignavibacteria bacterium]
MRNTLIIIIALIVFYYKNQAYDLVGLVYDINSQQPLVGATIRLEGTNYGALTNKEGKFTLTKISKGKYSLIVSFVGYETRKISVTIPYTDTLVLQLVPRSIQTQELVVTASKKLQTVQEVPISVSFVPSEIYNTRNYVRLDEAFRYVPGIIVNKDNINIRGSSGFSFGVGSRVAYLVDGIPMLSGDNSDAKYDIVPPEAISNIEIVKGAGSSLYGSNAIGGVINVTTKEALDTLSYSFRIQSGVYTKPKYEQWVYTHKLTTKTSFGGYFSNNFDLFKLLLSANYVNDESYRLFDKSTRYNIFAKLTRNFKNYGKFSLFGFFSSDKRNDWVYWNSLDSATRPPSNTDLSRFLISEKANVSLDHKFIITSNTFTNIKTSLFMTHIDNMLPPNSEEYRKSRAYSFNTEFQFNSHLLDNTLLTYGVNFTRNWVESNIYGRHKQNLVSIFSQVELSKFFNFIVTFGGRFDIEKSDSSRQYLEFSPKIGLNYLFDEKKSVRFSLARGFRSPSLAERFATIKYSGFEVEPNYNLRSEFSWSSEIGTLLEFDNFIIPIIFDFSIFYSYYNDLIEPNYSIEGKPRIKFENIMRAQIFGGEFVIRTLLFKKFPFSIGFTAIEPKDLKDNSILKYRSRFSLISSVSIPFNFINSTIDFRYISKIEKLDDMLRLQIEDYDALVPIYVVDLNLGIDLRYFKVPFSFNLAVQNLFDYYYAEMVGNLAPTRLISLKLQYYH